MNDKLKNTSNDFANERFSNALNLKSQKVPPIWLMRQAGRYQQSYRKLREKYKFEQLCKEPELSAKVGFNAVNEFDFDLCILFSDILFPLESLGMGLKYDPAPILEWHLDSENDFRKFIKPDEAIESLMFQKEALRASRQALPSDKSLIGFVGGFWTLFGYATQGSHQGHMIEAKKRRSLFNSFTENYMYPLIEMNISLQLEAGAELVMIFDTALGEVDPCFYKKEIFPFIKRLCEKFKNKLGYYTKGTTEDYFDEKFYSLPLLGVGWDHRWSLSRVLKENRYRGFKQGNFDQALLHQDLNSLKVSLRDYLYSFDDLSLDEIKGLVLGLGHGVLPKTPEENIKYFVNEVRNYFEKKKN